MLILAESAEGGREIKLHERVNESISRSIFNATRTGNGFNKIMSTGDEFNKVIMYIFHSRKEREILFEATCVWLKLCLQHVCEICNTTARKKVPWFNILSD